MSPEEKLFYYQKAAALYEVILDGKYAGFYDSPFLWNYAEIAIIYVGLGRPEDAAEYVHRILKALEKHMDEEQMQNKSKLLYATRLPRGAVTPEQCCQSLFRKLMTAPELESFRSEIAETQKRYMAYLSQNSL